MTKRKRVQFGTLATMVVIALPIAVVVSCGSEKGEIFDFSKLKKHDSAKLKETIDKFKEWLGKNAPNEGGKITKEGKLQRSSLLQSSLQKVVIQRNKLLNLKRTWKKMKFLNYVMKLKNLVKKSTYE